MESEVIIVGLGPVGAMAANLLGQYGISTRVFERLQDIYFAPRAIAIDAEALRVFGMLGMSDWIDQHVYKGGGELRTDSPPNGMVLIDMGNMRTQRRYGCRQLSTFHQPTVECELRDRLGEFPNVQVNLGHEVTDLVEMNGKVHVNVRAVSGLATEVYTCKYVLACDGGRSFVRKRLGLKYAGFSIPEHWLVMDIPSCDKSIDERWPVSTFVANPKRTFLHARLPGGMRRIEILLKEHEKALTVVREENTARLLEEIGVDVHKLTFERRMVYKFHSRAVTEWRKGRVLLLGDAAHCSPPTKGQGLCCGVQDAANICWKVALLCRGNLTNQLYADQRTGTESADDAESTVEGYDKDVSSTQTSSPSALGVTNQQAIDQLLDSYQLERQPWVARQAGIILKLRWLASLSSPFAVTVRNYLFLLLNVMAGREYLQCEMYKGKPDVWQGLLDSHSPRSGEYFIQPSVVLCRSNEDISSVMLDEVLGYKWSWISFEQSPSTSMSKEQYQYLESMGCTFIHALLVHTDPASVKSVPREVIVVDETGDLHQWLKACGAHSVLIRPDRFVYGTALKADGNEQVVDSLRRMLEGAKPLTRKRKPRSTMPTIRLAVVLTGLLVLMLLLLLYVVVG